MVPRDDVPVVQVLRVFVASPGGVEKEREAIRSVARELNEALVRHGWMIDVLGWEDRGPTGGRAQADINEDVAACHIFVGVLGQRWGAPTGLSSSGFAEEWTLASGRFQESGSPDLWIYFKETAGGGAGFTGEKATQFAAVQAFRSQIESGEIAFHKSFVDEHDFAVLFRRRIFESVLQRSSLTRAQIGQARIDLGLAYHKDPIALLADGADRLELATSSLETDPSGAAQLFTDLASEMHGLGFIGRADELQIQAGEAHLSADEPEAAVGLLRAVLNQQIWWLRLEEARHLLNGLGDAWPPELASELRGWRGCARSNINPTASASMLRDALSVSHAFALDQPTIHLWTIMACRCLLDEGQADDAGRCLSELPDLTTDQGLESAMIWADALRASGDARADEVWQRLRQHTLEAPASDPRTTAWVRTRIAQDEINQQSLADAEASYIAAATRWGSVPDGAEEAAAAFFSAVRAAELNGQFRFSSWSLREVAVAQRSIGWTYSRRARDLQISAISNRSADRGEKLELLRAALWLHQRAGLTSAVMRCTHLIAQAHEDAGNHLAALRLYCRIGSRDAAGRAAEAVTDFRAAAAAMAGDWPRWSDEARCRVLAIVGRATPADELDEITTFVLATTARTAGLFDNTHRTAAEALAQVALAADEDQQETADRLAELANEEDYTLCKAGRFALTALATMGRTVDIDFLIDQFVRDGRPDVPQPSWVAERLTTPSRQKTIRDAALKGHQRALIAAIKAGLGADDSEITALCVNRTIGLLSRQLGMTPDGSAVAGLIAFEVRGDIAAATGDEALKLVVAEAFLKYALETRWPMNNRVSAVYGLWRVIRPGGDPSWLERLRPLAAPEADLDDDIEAHWQMWANRGDLEAAALDVSAAHELSGGAPDWLDLAVRTAAFDRRLPMRVASWNAAWSHNRWFSSEAALYAFHDEPAVALAALRAWNKHHHEPVPTSVVAHLQESDDGDIRLALISALQADPESSARAKLREDPDGFVRAIARRDLIPQT